MFHLPHIVGWFMSDSINNPAPQSAATKVADIVDSAANVRQPGTDEQATVGVTKRELPKVKGKRGPSTKEPYAYNSFARKVAELRTAIMASVTVEDMMEIMVTLLEKAKAGNMFAIKEVFDRTLGKPVEPDVMGQIADLQSIVRSLISEREDWSKQYAAWLKMHPEDTRVDPRMATDTLANASAIMVGEMSAAA